MEQEKWCLPAVEALARSHAHAQAEVLTVQQANEPEPSNVDHRIAVQPSTSPPAPPPPLSPPALLRHPHITASGTPGELDLTSSIHSLARLIAAAHHLLESPVSPLDKFHPSIHQPESSIIINQRQIR